MTYRQSNCCKYRYFDLEKPYECIRAVYDDGHCILHAEVENKSRQDFVNELTALVDDSHKRNEPLELVGIRFQRENDFFVGREFKVPVHFAGVAFRDVVTFRSCTFQRTCTFSDTIFVKGAQFVECKFKSNLKFESDTVNGDRLVIRDVNIASDLKFSNCHLNTAVHLNKIGVHKDTLFLDCNFDSGLVVEGSSVPST